LPSRIGDGVALVRPPTGRTRSRSSHPKARRPTPQLWSPRLSSWQRPGRNWASCPAIGSLCSCKTAVAILEDLPGPRRLMGMAVVPPETSGSPRARSNMSVNHSGARALLFDDSFAGTVRSLGTKLHSVARGAMLSPMDRGIMPHIRTRGLIGCGTRDSTFSAGRSLRLLLSRAIHRARRGLPKGCVNPHRGVRRLACAGSQQSTA